MLPRVFQPPASIFARSSSPGQTPNRPLAHCFAPQTPQDLFRPSTQLSLGSTARTSAHSRCSASSSSCDSIDADKARHEDSRRTFLGLTGLAGAFQMLPTTARAEEEEKPALVTLTSDLGVKYQIVRDGDGEPAKVGDYVTFDYVLRRSNGYFVYSTTGSGSSQLQPVKFAQNFQEEPVTFQLGSGQLIKGLEEVLVGCQVGERIRALVPPEVGYVNPALEPLPPSFGPRRELSSHSNQPLFFEIELRRISS